MGRIKDRTREMAEIAGTYHQRRRKISAVFSGYKKCKSLFNLSLTQTVEIYIKGHCYINVPYIIGHSKGKKQLDLNFPDYILQTTTSIRLDTPTNKGLVCASHVLNP